MNDKNPYFAENVNYTQSNPLKEFMGLAVVALILTVTLTIILSLSIRWLAPLIPFSFEKTLFSKMMSVEGSFSNDDPTSQSKVEYLQHLATELAKAQQLPDDMPITVHWMDDDMVNAFATLGGNIFITKGLWEKMPSENALAMVMAHEIAHVSHRDPIKSLSSGVGLSLLFSWLFNGDRSTSALLGSGGLITSLHFTRAMEQEADSKAVETLYHHYGHVGGFVDFFEIILEEDDENHLVFLETHPLTEERIKLLESMREKNNWSTMQERILPLPQL